MKGYSLVYSLKMARGQKVVMVAGGAEDGPDCFEVVGIVGVVPVV